MQHGSIYDKIMVGFQMGNLFGSFNRFERHLFAVSDQDFKRFRTPVIILCKYLFGIHVSIWDSSDFGF